MVTLIHPRMLTSLEATFYVTVVTIQEYTEARDSVGQPIKTWANLAGHVALPCSFAPISPGSPQAAEMHRPDGRIVKATHHISLNDNYSGIMEAMRAVIDSVNYDILSVEEDSHEAMTRLRVEVVT